MGDEVSHSGTSQKARARGFVAALAMTEAQATSANRAIRRATNASTIEVERRGDTLVVGVRRPGRDGVQLLEYVAHKNGDKQLVQYAFDAAGRLVHEDIKRA